MIPYLLNSQHIIEAEFVIDKHYYTSPNQQEELPTISIKHSKELPEDALSFELRVRIWALHNHPYLPFMLFSPFRGGMRISWLYSIQLTNSFIIRQNIRRKVKRTMLCVLHEGAVKTHLEKRVVQRRKVQQISSGKMTMVFGRELSYHVGR